VIFRIPVSLERGVRQLTLSETHAAMAYYFDNQDEIDTEIRTEWELVQRFRQEYNVEAADINPSEIFAGVRDKSPGREVIF